MQHLTPDEIERFADERLGPAPTGARSEHVSACARCREEVDLLRTLIRSLTGLDRRAPSPEFAETVMSRVDLPHAALDRALAGLPTWSPSPGFSQSVLASVDLPHPRLDRALERLPAWAPTPGFATAVMARVRLPIPWPERLWRFARRRRVALAAASVGTVAVSGGAAAWLFGTQGLSPVQLLTMVAAGMRAVSVDAMLAVGRFGYRLGLVDAGGSVMDRIDPTTALGSLGLAGLAGIASLWVMARLFRSAPQPIALERAA